MSPTDPRSTYDALRLRAAPFLDEGVVEEADLRIAAELGRMASESRADVLLALALVVASPRRGDVALDIARVAAAPGAELPPADAWLELVASSPLVAAPGRELGAPFVAYRGLLCSRRSFEQQARLARSLRARADAGDAPLLGAAIDRASLDALLARLFPGEAGAEPDRQRVAVTAGVHRLVTVITGGPGTGKTFTIRALLAALFELTAARGGGLRVALAAPTGKAAARITQAIAEGLDALDVSEATRAALASLEARTLHRLLGSARAQARAGRRPEGGLPYDVVVVDEASMVDLTMMARLVDALGPETRLVLLGDRHQLASVEAGAVLADLVPDGAVAAGALAASIVHLERPRRFDASAPVGRIARAIGEGTPAAFDRAVALFEERRGEGAEAELFPHHRAGRVTDEALARLAAGYERYLGLLEAGPADGEQLEAFHGRVLAAFDAYRVLCAHRVGPFGADAIARAVGAILLRRRGRPADEVDGGYLGKPVLVVRNSYDTGLFNGDVGVFVTRGEERVVVFAGDAGEVRYLRPERLPPHELALATTVHKAQGSQFDHVALVLPDAPSAVLTREVVYTAITRARSRVTVAGDAALLRLALDRPTVRSSALAHMLWGSSG